MAKMKLLETRKKVSIDEERNEPVELGSYKKDFIENPETSNKI
jgi:hypothetical protein